MSAPAGAPSDAALADLKAVVSLGERLSSVADEQTLAVVCAGSTARLVGGPAGSFVTDRVLVAEGTTCDARALEAVRGLALERFGAEDGVVSLPAARLPASAQAALASTGCRAVLAAPLRTQRDIVGALAVCLRQEDPRGRVLLAAIAQLASAFLGALRVIDALRAQTREVEALLEKRTRELRAAETNLIVTDRLAAIGTLAAGIGHEIANPLATVMLNNGALANRLARAGLPAGVLTEAQRLLAENDEALDRIRTIVGELRTFVRREEYAFSVIDVCTVVESAVRLARAQLRGVDVKLALTPVSPVKGSVPRLGQVFLNLLVNAAQALAGRSDGRIEVASEQRGAEVVLRVKDNGPGIAPEVLPRIFDLYFTTKAPGEGTGLGLAIAHDIVHRHGGRIEVDSVPGAGATFRVILPAQAQARPPVRPPTSPSVMPGRRKPSSPAPPVPAIARPRLLVIDDEPAILRALARELGEEFDVATAACGDAAAELAARGPRFDAILCDLNLVGETGIDVSARLAGIDPGAPERTIYMSGGSLSEAARTAAQRDPGRFVSKPFDMPALIQILKRVAAEPRAELAASAPTP